MVTEIHVRGFYLLISGPRIVSTIPDITTPENTSSIPLDLSIYGTDPNGIIGLIWSITPSETDLYTSEIVNDALTIIPKLNQSNNTFPVVMNLTLTDPTGIEVSQGININVIYNGPTTPVVSVSPFAPEVTDNLTCVVAAPSVVGNLRTPMYTYT
jgi:hypothetical protein